MDGESSQLSASAYQEENANRVAVFAIQRTGVREYILNEVLILQLDLRGATRPGIAKKCLTNMEMLVEEFLELPTIHKLGPQANPDDLGRRLVELPPANIYARGMPPCLTLTVRIMPRWIQPILDLRGPRPVYQISSACGPLMKESELPPISRDAAIPVIRNPVSEDASHHVKLAWVDGLWRDLSQYMYIFSHKRNAKKYEDAFMQPWPSFDDQTPPDTLYDLTISRIFRMKEALDILDCMDTKRYEQLATWKHLADTMHDAAVASDARR